MSQTDLFYQGRAWNQRASTRHCTWNHLCCLVFNLVIGWILTSYKKIHFVVVVFCLFFVVAFAKTSLFSLLLLRAKTWLQETHCSRRAYIYSHTEFVSVANILTTADKALLCHKLLYISVHTCLSTRILQWIYNNMSSLHLNATFTFCSNLLPPSGLSHCLPGERVEWLLVWMLLLPAFLAPDLQGTEEKSSIPRRLLHHVLVFRQIHCPDFPAGGALGLDLCFAPFPKPLAPPPPLVLQRPGVDLITLLWSAATSCYL